jgi:hypothetical protein
LSPQAQKLAAAQKQPSPQPTTQQADALLSAAKMAVSSNPGRALKQLQALIAQYPNSPDALKARQLLGMIPQAK